MRIGAGDAARLADADLGQKFFDPRGGLCGRKALVADQRLGDLSALGNPSAIDELKGVLEAEKGQ